MRLFGHQHVGLPSTAGGLGASVETLSGEGGGLHQSSNSHCLVGFSPLNRAKSLAFIQFLHMCLSMHLVWSSKRWFAFWSCLLRCLHWDFFRRAGGIASIFKQPLLGEFWSPYHGKKHSIHPIYLFVFINELVWSPTHRFALYSCGFRCLCRDSFRWGGGIASIFKQPLLGGCWSLDHDKKHSIHLITHVVVDAFGLFMNALVCLLKLSA